MTAGRSSLEKLQSLDKDYDTFEEQLDALIAILRLHGQEADRHHRQPRYGKASFALRWLLSKLQVDHASRTSAKAWRLLAQLVFLLPPTIAARFLKSSDPLRIFQEALEAAFPPQLYTGEVGSAPTKEDDRQGQGNYSESGGDDEAVISLRKRKRKAPKNEERGKGGKRSKITEDTPNGSPAISETQSGERSSSLNHDDRAALFLSMSSCLNKLVSPDSAQTAQPFLPVLKTSPDSLGRVMGNWLRAYHFVVEVPQCAPVDLRASTLIDPALRLWHLSSHEVDARSFAQYVLLPASLLMNLLGNPSRRSHTLAADDAYAMTRNLERLIARHVLLPARRAFHESPKIEATAADINLSDLLEPISGQYMELRSSSRIVETLQPSTHKLGLAACLFSIAIRSAPRSSVQKRLSEQPWLEHSLLTLVDCLRIDANGSITTLQRSLDELEDMLRVAQRHEVTFSRAVLRDIALRFGGLSQTPQQPRWSLLARVSTSAVITTTSNNPHKGSSPRCQMRKEC